MMCTEGQTLYVEKWCSASQTASYPPWSMIRIRSSARLYTVPKGTRRPGQLKNWSTPNFIVCRVCRRAFAIGKRGWELTQVINRVDARKVLFALPSKLCLGRWRGTGTQIEHVLGVSYAHDIPCTLHLIHRKRAYDALRPGLVGVRFSSTDLDTAHTQTAFRRREGRQTRTEIRLALQPKGTRGLQGLGDPTERRQPGSGGEQSTAWYRTPGQAGLELASNDGRLDGTSRRRTRLWSGAT